ncbi:MULTISPECIES: ABC transporter permease [unclassified Rhizobium]|uniref:ABC transporter permease n=1 Tax=unclassified Rhizobium TaxID=2613769 RepID=UPI001AE3A8FC|nr:MULTISPECIES: ABC transporter permease [unclassified Rhizobium]MBP2460172.1 ABC-type polysaccharide/polyol phosphate export permease [Rhizobium sp. PvP014]MBP2531531.1 ABC-type polysaccharide/polyol phosphate export permease [Rhizobium sp. PvP099]
MGENDDNPTIGAAAAFLRKKIQADSDVFQRSLVYRELRDLVIEKMANAKVDGFGARLAVEYAIQRVEKEFVVVSKHAVRNKAEDAWHLVDPTSPFNVLVKEPYLDGPAGKVFSLSQREQIRRCSGLAYRLRIILSLWLQAINHEVSHDRLGYIWLILDPLIHVMIICFVSLFIHPTNIFDMPSFPFGVIGACFWLTFRTAASASMTGGGVLKPQLEHPYVQRFDIMAARSVNALIIYFGVGSWLIGIAMWMGLATWPANFPGFLACLIIIWLMGMFYGITANSLLLLYPGYRRVNGFVIRVIAIMSGLFYVSEQVPEQIKVVLLLNPLLHIVQFARSSWFQQYNTTDASTTYVMFWLLGLGLLALACLAVDEKRPDNVRL